MAHKKCNSPEFLTHFIDIHKANECLWKLKNKSYANKELCKKACLELLNYYKTFDPSATKGTVGSKVIL
jgi:hypothetical protein